MVLGGVPASGPDEGWLGSSQTPIMLDYQVLEAKYDLIPFHYPSRMVMIQRQSAT